MKKIKNLSTLLCLALFPFSFLFAADSGDMNKANNPLTSMLGVNFHDYLIFSHFGNDDTGNSFFLRGVLPQKIDEVPHLFRLSMPYSSVPTQSGDNVDGFGDLNLFDIWLTNPINGIEFGVGPYFVFPTASEDETGAGKWQAGLSGIAIKPMPEGILGALLTYQHSFAGPSDRSTQNLLTFQPFAIYNLPEGYYLRSSGVLNFNWANGEYYIPVGAGLGRVWKLKNGNILNSFVEPQVTFIHGGDGLPKFQTYLGFNMQFPLGE
jgi:hypothetical protein